MKVLPQDMASALVGGYDGRAVGTCARYDDELALLPCVDVYAITPTGESLLVSMTGKSAVELGVALVKNGNAISNLEASYNARENDGEA